MGPAPRIVVLGGGPAGLGAACLLARNGFDAVLLEQKPWVGGNAGSFELAGMQVDYGSHRLHPAAQAEIMQLLRGLLGEDLLLRRRRGRILLAGRWLRFPLQARDLLLNAPRNLALGVAADLLRGVLPAGTDSTDSFERTLRDGLGGTICENFYFPYAKKIWGMDPGEISSTQARRRVSSNSIGKLLMRLVPRIGGGGAPAPGRYFYYPRRGFGQICDALLAAARHSGATVRLGATVRRVKPGTPVHTVEFEQGGRGHSLTAAHLWSTIPVNALAGLAHPPPPDPVMKAARDLRFRGMVLVYLVLATRQFSPFDAHYFPGADIRITRLSEPRNYSGCREPAGTTVLCAELPCQPGDPHWRADEAALGQLVRDDLQRAGIPVRCPVLNTVVKRLTHAYPLYPKGFDAAFAGLDEWVGSLPRVLTFGRQGLFAHDNTHHALHMAHSAVDCLGRDGRFDAARWARAREAFADFVVED